MSKPDIYTPNIHALKLLRADSTTAWITDEGILHVVPLFNHLAFFSENEGFLPDISAFLRKFAVEGQGLSISKPHMAEAMDMIYARGWGRVGTFGGDKIELDCAREHLTELRRKTKAIARVLNRALVCRVIHPSQQKPRKAPQPLARDAVWSSFVPGFIGWLAPDGRIFEVPPNAPFSAFIDDHDLIPETAKAFEEAVADDHHRQRSEFAEFAQEEDSDGHIGWHRFWEEPYNPPHDERRNMTALVLSHGWGALVVERDGIVVLEAAEGETDLLAAHLEPLVAKAGCVVETRDWDAVAPSAPTVRG